MLCKNVADIYWLVPRPLLLGYPRKDFLFSDFVSAVGNILRILSQVSHTPWVHSAAIPLRWRGGPYRPHPWNLQDVIREQSPHTLPSHPALVTPPPPPPTPPQEKSISLQLSHLRQVVLSTTSFLTPRAAKVCEFLLLQQ